MSFERRNMLRLAGHAVEVAVTIPELSAPSPRGVIVIGHGRVNDLDHASLKAVAEGAGEVGFAAVRFNFPYRQRGDSEPDSFRILNEVHAGAVDWACSKLGGRRVVLAGKSLAARTAIEVYKAGRKAAGLLFLGYPLHAPLDSPDEDPAKLLDKPLEGINRPVLIIQGQEDALARTDLLRRTAARLEPRPELVLIPGADHGFATPGGDHEPPAKNLAAIQSAAKNWLDRLEVPASVDGLE